MRITFQNLPEQVDLVKQMGSKKPEVARQAQEAFASLLSKTIAETYEQADTTRMVYRDLPFNEDDDPSIPIDLYADVGQGHFTVWSQQIAGGLPTNQLIEPVGEMKFSTYRLDSAVSWLKKYARKARLDVVGRGLERLMQEILLKTQWHAWSVLMSAAATSVHGTRKHVIRADSANNFSLDDLNHLFTLVRRLNSSFVGGTPTANNGKLTDLVISPEIKEQIRSMAYQPVNTKGANGIAGTQYSGVVPLSEVDRAGVWNGAGTEMLFNVVLTELLELGVGQLYNTIFDDYAASTSYAKADGTGGAVFDGANEEVILGLDLTRDFAYRPIAINEDYQSTFTLVPDDQFVTRSEKMGLYGFITEGRLVLETRPIVALIV